ncbi:manganese resistance protein MNR2 [Mycena galericulata]|nr:manganese resistance protein MNR2 [Mycena galericulata]
MSSPPRDEDVILSSSPITIGSGSPIRRGESLSRSESDISRPRLSPTAARSFDPNDPQFRERQRTMDVDMAMQLSRARRETISVVDPTERVFPDISTHEQHDIDMARGQPEGVPENVAPDPTFLEINHISAQDPTMLVHESQLRAAPASTFGGLPTYQPNASHSEFDYTPMDEFATAERTRLNLASPKFSVEALRARTVAPNTDDIEDGPSSSRRKLSHSNSNPRPRHHRKGGGGKMALFEGNTDHGPPSFTIDPAQTTTGIPGILNTGHDRPYRFSFYSNGLSATIHARSLSELPAEGQSFTDLFSGVAPPPRDQNASRERPTRPGPSPVVGDKTPRHSNYKPGELPRHSAGDSESSTWWLDVQSPTDEEMKMLSKVFSIHPLTTEDIQMEETREKIELFRNYYLVCFRSFDQDPYSPTHLEPLNMYIIVFREGTLSFHFRPTPHPQNVRRRIKQLKDYISVTSDWISYALIDDITDAFGPLIQGIEYEVDSIDELVLILKEAEQSDMLRRIGTCRKKVMGLLRLMGNKADVVKGLAKRCNEHWRVAPTSDIGLYLSDIQDHLITMTQNLNHYEKILSRSHSNYLAQISIEMTDANNQINDVLSKLTALGTVLIPMNLVTGLWGMNVHVPGQEVPGYAWFVSIIAGLAAFAIIGGYSTYRFMVHRR